VPALASVSVPVLVPVLVTESAPAHGVDICAHSIFGIA
jgi:hypothetical protein